MMGHNRSGDVTLSLEDRGLSSFHLFFVHSLPSVCIASSIASIGCELKVYVIFPPIASGVLIFWGFTHSPVGTPVFVTAKPYITSFFVITMTINIYCTCTSCYTLHPERPHPTSNFISPPPKNSFCHMEDLHDRAFQLGVPSRRLS